MCHRHVIKVGIVLRSPGRAYRQCDASGRWEQVSSINRTWANYTECTMYLTSNQRVQEEVCTCVGSSPTLTVALKLQKKK